MRAQRDFFGFLCCGFIGIGLDYLDLAEQVVFALICCWQSSEVVSPQ